MTITATIRQAILCLMLLTCVIVRSEASPHIAVLSSDKSAWGDLLMTRLSANPAISLVERNDLGKALDEVELKELLGDRKKRSRLGEIAGADFLVMLDVMGPRARLVICDTRLGVSLEDFRMQVSEQTQDQTIDIMVDTVLRTLRSFEGGVRHVVAVPDFISRDLIHERIYLQRDYAVAVQAAYRRIPGTAVVALEEAKAIAAERDLTHVKSAELLVSTFIEGEYRTARNPQTNHYQAEVTLRARNGAGVQFEKKLPATAISRSFAPLMDCLEENAFTSSAPAATKLDDDIHYKLLLERAKAFSSLADYANSTSLLELALLLRPDDDDIRIKLIEDYYNQALKQKHFDKDFWPKGAKLDATNPDWLAAMDRAIQDWQRSMQHCAYLVENRRVSREKACTLAEWAFHSSPHLYNGWCMSLSVFNEVQDNFIRYSMSQVAYLEPAKPRERGVELISTIFHSIGEIRNNGDCAEKKLDLIAELLLERLPESFTLSNTLCTYINRWDYDQRFQKHLQGFAERLIKSNRRAARAYGYYVMARLGAVKGRPDSELLIIAEQAVHELDHLDFDPVETGSPAGGYMHTLAKNIKNKIEAKSRAPVIEKVAAPPPAPKPPEPRIRLERIHLRLAGEDSTGNGNANDIQKSNLKQKSGLDSINGPMKFRPMGEGLDAIWWRHGPVFFIGMDGQTTEVFADKRMDIADVLHDGQFVWIASTTGWGLAVLDKSGKLLARIDEKQGLPPCTSFLVAHPISPGCIMVSASFSYGKRSWIAIVRFDGETSAVDVVHEAVHTHSAGDSSDPYKADPLLAFIPRRTFEHVVPGPSPRRLIFIDSWISGKPIRVTGVPTDTWITPNPGTYPEGNYPPGDPNTRTNNFANIDGTLWVSGFDSRISGYRYDDAKSAFHVVCDNYKYTSNYASSMARDGDWLYAAGAIKWLRFNLKTGEEEILPGVVKEQIPTTWNSQATLWNSSHYGLVAHFDSPKTFYQVKLIPEKND